MIMFRKIGLCKGLDLQDDPAFFEAPYKSFGGWDIVLKREKQIKKGFKKIFPKFSIKFLYLTIQNKIVN
ncbi:MAG: hypothetical protein CM15mP65_18130 [Crocinitomicaceae bacterium]|nr:MAG: hypothetical protein CM15mP65_18130 [Crocinitomicaceae bacterium]